ncbi:hypothetical protein PoB_003146700 [Plakobranchus ocellatus]|uniref:Uncharacterized protein n=1 Tax=Plakobranchus ocellatus TaxID=259542 RepID=A0AAV4ADG2_9GAST|nr:hypothetical protein PoB_003146700 [Plakobranchus ocellatus]
MTKISHGILKTNESFCGAACLVQAHAFSGPETAHSPELSNYEVNQVQEDGHMTQHRLRYRGSLGRALDEGVRSRLLLINQFASHTITEGPGLDAGDDQRDVTGNDHSNSITRDASPNWSHDEDVDMPDIGQCHLSEHRLWAALKTLQAVRGHRLKGHCMRGQFCPVSVSPTALPKPLEDGSGIGSLKFMNVTELFWLWQCMNLGM